MLDGKVIDVSERCSTSNLRAGQTKQDSLTGRGGTTVLRDIGHCLPVNMT
jgi:hypothetical protein